MAAACRRFRDDGIPADEPFSFTRPVETPDAKGDASFCVARLDAAATPHAGLFLVQHFTPELVWHRAWQTHDNGALGIRDITITVADPGAPTAAYDKLFGTGSYSIDGDSATLSTGRQPLHFTTAQGLARRFGEAAAEAPAAGPPCAALGIRVGDLGHTAATLAANGVPYETTATGALQVSPAHACGVILEFASD